MGPVKYLREYLRSRSASSSREPEKNWSSPEEK